MPNMPILEVNDFHKSYKKLKAVDGISFSVEENEIFGLLGPNGAGKTTTVECIEGLRTFDSGSISVLGLDPQTHGQQLRKRIGMQLQESALPGDIKTWEALDLYSSFYDTAIDWKPLVQQIGLEEKLNTRFSKLSGGQKQRLYIALALVNDPEIVFFDELTTGLDPQSRRVMWDLVREIRDRGKTIVLTTHFMEEAETLCDHLLIIDMGKIIAAGTPENLVREQGLDVRILFTSTGKLGPDTFADLPSVSSFTQEGRRCAVSGKGDLLIKEVIDHLAAENIPFRDIRSEHPNLEDVFLAITGRRIRE
jgi:ABC-2 type transport system ATP-binding protein